MMARAPKSGFEAPRGRRTSVLSRTPQPSRDRFGRFTEWIARAMGTPAFLLILTLFCVAWIFWNSAMAAFHSGRQPSSALRRLTHSRPAWIAARSWSPVSPPRAPVRRLT